MKFYSNGIIRIPLSLTQKEGENSWLEDTGRKIVSNTKHGLFDEWQEVKNSEYNKQLWLRDESGETAGAISQRGL